VTCPTRDKTGRYKTVVKREWLINISWKKYPVTTLMHWD
jgi:hypothetical protein